MRTILFYVLMAAVLFPGLVTSQVVNTTSGRVQGLRLKSQGVTKFLGIPYAEAPKEELRFKPPVRKARMEGLFNATSNNLVCPQGPYYLTNETILTEDCLRLDIYVPLDQQEMTSLPVMVWIHGGGFLYRSSSNYDATQLAKQGVIVVAVNFRIGILGFLSTEDNNAVGNFGLRDQCSAIEWVVDNIANFGGNESDVTIFGLSAGSASVLQLAMSSLCQGKFHRVIAQSGSPLAPWAYTKYPLRAAKNLATTLQCPSENGALVSCLQQLTWEEILAKQSEFIYSGFDWAPSYTRDIFPENPFDIINGNLPNSAILKRFQSLDLIIGLTKEEGEQEFLSSIPGARLNETDAEFDEKSHEKWLRQTMKPYLTDKELNKMYPVLKYRYTDWDHLDDIYANARTIIHLLGDLTFHVDVVQTARAHARLSSVTSNNDAGQGNTYFYHFLRKGSWQKTYPWTEGATHADDVNFMFYNMIVQNSGTSEEKALAQAMIEYWTNFAKTGSPNAPSLIFSNTTWPMYDTNAEKYIKLDTSMSPDSTGSHPFGKRVAFWEKLFKTQLKMVKSQKCENVDPSNSADKVAVCHVLITCLLSLVFFMRV